MNAVQSSLLVIALVVACGENEDTNSKDQDAEVGGLGGQTSGGGGASGGYEGGLAGQAGLGGGAGMASGGKAGSAGSGGTAASGGVGSGGTAASGGVGSACGKLLLGEKFADNKLASRGWQGDLGSSGYSVVHDAALGTKAFNMNFKKAAISPGGVVQKNFSASAEITVKYRMRMSNAWNWTVPHHMIMLQTDRDIKNPSSPANAYGSTYLEWEWKDAGIFLGKFQDNRAINCSYGYKDLTNITENRSVGGFQTWSAPKGQIVSKWGDPCKDGISAYTGQSVLTLKTNAAKHAMTKNAWWTLTAYLKMNSIKNGKGIHNGSFYVEWQGPKDKKPVRVMYFKNVLWRAGGPNKALKWARFMIAPWLHKGATADMWVRIADIEVRGGQCTSG